MHCPVCGINIPKFLITLIVGFVFVYGFEYLIHGILLMPAYEATADLWRGTEEMQEHFPIILLSQFGYTFFIVLIYALFIKAKCPMKAGLFGLFAGATVGITMLGSYAYYPLPSLDIPVYWFLGAAVQGMLLGIISWIIYRNSGKSCCAKGTCDSKDKAEEK